MAHLLAKWAADKQLFGDVPLNLLPAHFLSRTMMYEPP